MARTENGIEYEVEEGNKPALIFIHGWLGSRESWKLVKPRLDLDNQLVFIDQRCHGQSRCSKFSMSTLAHDLKSVVEDLDLENPVMVGHSMGGMAALDFAVKHDNFSSLVLLGTSSSTPEPENETFDYYLENLGSVDREKWAEKIAENYAGRTENAALKKESKRELVQADEEVLRNGLEAMKEHDVKNKLGDFEKSALVVAGDKDGAITLEKSRELAEILNADLEIIDSGHLIPWEKPERVAELISRFMQTEIE